jgi:hypothetical protein
MMRFVVQAVALVLLAAPALAQTTTTPAPAPAAAPPAMTVAPPEPSAPAAAAPAAPKRHVGHRQTLAQHFAAANATSDGHLTKDQAVAAKWSYVTKHFAAMDTSSKGYVTVDDIRAYAHAQHAVHRKPAAPAPTTPPATNS